MFSDSRMNNRFPKSFQPWLSWFAIVPALTSLSLVPSACAEESSLRELNQCLQAPDLIKASSLGEQLFHDHESSFDITLPLARLARELQRSGDTKQAIKFYRYAVEASERPQAKNLPTHTQNMLRIASALVLIDEEQLMEACDLMESLVNRNTPDGPEPQGIDANSAPDKSLKTAHTVLNQIGTGSLEREDYVTAERAFTLALQLPINEQSTSFLGQAWAIARRGKEPELAAARLDEFLEQYPDHHDAAQAAMLAIDCRQQAGDSEGVLRIIKYLLESWPESTSSKKVVNEFADTPSDQIPDSVNQWILNQSTPMHIGDLGEKILALALIANSATGNENQWSLITNELSSRDTQGTATAKALNELTRLGRDAAAERFAGILIDPVVSMAQVGSTRVTGAAREAGCRWAGRQSKWSMLALASESENLQEPSISLTLDVERLLAEALVQSGRLQDALTWWNHLVDVRDASDFSTLLRCAEAETSVGMDLAKAVDRIEQARLAAAKDPFRIALTNLLEAELHIRRTDFAGSRRILEPVVSNPSVDANLRGRAQWLIGETFYLQEKYPLAIDAYRKVESIGPNTQWIAASLIQAGKSFEHLGHQREAMICYGNLVTRFADTSYAKVANQRIALLSPKVKRPSGVAPKLMQR